MIYERKKKMVLKMYAFYMSVAKRLGGTVGQAVAFCVLVRLILRGVEKIQNAGGEGGC